MNKHTCPNCGNEFQSRILHDELGWFVVCPECNGSFNINISAFPSSLEHVSMEVVECFENLLDKHGIIIPDSDRSGDDSEAPIYGRTYGDLISEITEVLAKHINKQDEAYK